MLTRVTDGAEHPEIKGVELVSRPALVASAVDALEADGYILGGPANLGYLSGAVKHFFDTVYYPCLDHTGGRPFGLYLHGNDDCAGALNGAEKIITGLGWTEVVKPVVVTGAPSTADLDQCWELGAVVAATLSAAEEG